MQKNRHRFSKLFLSMFLILILFVLAFILYVKFGLDREIDLSLINPGGTSVTKIYTFPRENGIIQISSPKEVEEERIFLENSEWCSYYELPNNLKNAFIAIEDHRFYEHNGVNWPRTIQATLSYIANFGRASFGGSTITQQLVKNLTGDNMVTPKRKIEEILRAQDLEKKLSKNEILELYLNVVYLSQNCYGVQSASRIYFGKDAEELSLAECASLASIVKSPTKYDPYKNPDKNKARRKLVLQAMLEENMISLEEYHDALDDSLSINSNIENENSAGIYSWFTEKLITDVKSDLKRQYNLSDEGALMMINKGGLKIYSTMDEMAQKSVDKVFQNYIAYLKPIDGLYPEASCVILDPSTSDILAIAGGVGVKSANRIFNRATDAKRPLGSVIKPLSVYGPAIEYQALTYGTTIDDVPMNNNGVFWPHNATHKYMGLVSVDYALTHSLNTVAVKALGVLGIDRSYDFCKNKFKLNLIEADKSEAPLALGQLTEGETLLNATNAYASFANGGVISKPRSYLYVTDNDGNILLSNEYDGERIMSEDSASVMNIMLKNVVNYGTAKNISLKNDYEIAGKTGTSGENKDKWFIGYTPYYVCGVWVGYDTPKNMSINFNPATSMFDAIMTSAHSEKEKGEALFNSGNLITKDFCVDSGKMAADSCRLDLRLNRVQKGYYIKGTEPKTECELHKEVYINLQTGLIADKNLHPIYRRKISVVDYVRDSSLEGFYAYDEPYLMKSRCLNNEKMP